MAESVEEIQAAMIADIAAQPDLTYKDKNGITRNITTNTSKRAKWRLWTWVVAAAINTNEQNTDQNIADTETAIASAIPGTKEWLAQKIFEFQYSTTIPQIIQLINLIPAYPIVDPTLRIVTRCSVITTNNNQCLIKVAQQEPPTAFDDPMIAALQAFIDRIGTPGVNYKISSTLADKLFLDASIYYQGQYSAIIQANVIAAINTFLANLSSVQNFNGKLQLSDLESLIRSVPGVNDVILNNVRARQDDTPLIDAAYMVQTQTWISRQWPTIAGYIVEETTAGNTFADSLTFIAQ